ncbi:helix-turn-helix DNA-binding domain protein [Gordonia phage ODay]|nr:helix-turn-helix DNA-binding domain protein [Gordonia phage ODay]
MAETWWQYLERITGTSSGKQIAHATGVDAATISRWRSGRVRPNAETAVKIARDWNRPPVEALIAAGILSVGEFDQAVQVGRSINDFSDTELVTEIGRRLSLRNTDTQE